MDERSYEHAHGARRRWIQWPAVVALLTLIVIAAATAFSPLTP